MKTSHKRILQLILATALCVFGATSCRTVHGIGQDVQHVGSHIERAADR